MLEIRFICKYGYRKLIKYGHKQVIKNKPGLNNNNNNKLFKSYDKLTNQSTN